MIDLALDNRLFINSKFEAAIQELDLLLNTENTELIGNANYGVSLEQFLWILTPTLETFRKYINEKLSTLLYFNQFKHDVDVQYLDGEFRSIYHIIIKLYLNDTEYIQKEYEYR